MLIGIWCDVKLSSSTIWDKRTKEGMELKTVEETWGANKGPEGKGRKWERM